MKPGKFKGSIKVPITYATHQIMSSPGWASATASSSQVSGYSTVFYPNIPVYKSHPFWDLYIAEEQ